MTHPPGAVRPLSVLLLADEPVSARFFSELLRKAGHAFSSVAGAAEAVVLLGRGEADLVVLGELGWDVRLGAALQETGVPLVLVETPGDQRAAVADRVAPVERLRPPLAAQAVLAVLARVAEESRQPPEVVEVIRHLERFRERREFRDKLTHSFLEECPPRREVLIGAIQAGDCARVAQEAHGFISTALAMGSGCLAEIARGLEHAAHEERREELAALLPEFTATLERIEVYLRSLPPPDMGQPEPSESNS